MGLLDGQVVFITGGARGQGRAHAIASAREGADVVLFDRAEDIDTVGYPLATADDLQQSVKEVEAIGRRALSFVGDVRSQTALDEAVAGALSEFGKIDALIANAGIWATGQFWELTDEQWDDMVGTCLTGVWRSIKAVAPQLIERQQGSIVITASVDALEPGGVYAHYTAAKHGVVGLMKSVALELGPHGARCNAIAPGAVDTLMLNNQPGYDLISGHPGGSRDDLIEGGHRFNVLKQTHLLDPSNLADAAVYLNSAMASRVTGVVLPVDAGHMLLAGFNHAPVR
ncbi:mycofactocin-coupled SDR family oxidoreductase [Rhodococcus opacus]|uniref:mycofactocin-coupled SDR family oxidoreductase n=3 Tax=Rhodococcus opacus TaxID=37919 RepID=UPI001D022B35|nr:mycofactocin-coupled SDR family oxidoreductase [Rhodococcus opacus]UDH01199.1 mycofactocin-coupled SDR family oxidoreductase [Rhodococcus opacus PD630]